MRVVEKRHVRHHQSRTAWKLRGLALFFLFVFALQQFSTRNSLRGFNASNFLARRKRREHRCSSWACVKSEMVGYDLFDLLQEIVNPFTGWYLCEYYLGSEYEHWLGDDAFQLLRRRRLLEPLPACHMLTKHLSSIFVETTKITEFVKVCLPRLKVPIILISGRWHVPPVIESAETNKILESDFVYKWFLQNPFKAHKKIVQLPYGVMHANLPSFAHVASRKDILLSNRTKLLSLPLGKTNGSREQLTGSHANRLRVDEYYRKLTQVDFVISPTGDRPDCHRHLEAIGLGARPICNCPKHFERLFGDLMVFSSLERMKTLETAREPLNKLDLQPITLKDQDLLSTGFGWSRVQEEIFKYTGQP